MNFSIRFTVLNDQEWNAQIPKYSLGSFISYPSHQFLLFPAVIKVPRKELLLDIEYSIYGQSSQVIYKRESGRKKGKGKLVARLFVLYNIVDAGASKIPMQVHGLVYIFSMQENNKDAYLELANAWPVAAAAAIKKRVSDQIMSDIILHKHVVPYRKRLQLAADTQQQQLKVQFPEDWTRTWQPQSWMHG